MDGTETARLVVTVGALAITFVTLIMHRRDKVLDALSDLSERVTRAKTQLEGLDKRVEAIEVYIRKAN